MADENKKAYFNERDAAKDLEDSLRKALGIRKDGLSIVKESISYLEKEIKSYDKLNARVETLKRDTINIKELEEEIRKVKQKEIIDGLKQQDLQKRIAKTYEEAALEQKNIAFQELAFSKAKTKEERDLAEQRWIAANMAHDDLIGQIELLQLSVKESEKLKEVNAALIEYLKEQIKLEKEANSQLGLSGNIMKVFANKLGLGNSILADMVVYIKNAQAQKKEISKWDVFKEGVKSAGKTIKENLNDPLVAFGLVMKANNMILGGLKSIFNFVKDIAQKVLSLITGWNSQVFEFAKNLGVGETQSRMMMNHFQEMALTSGPLFLGVKGISEAFASMTESLGFIAPMNDEMLTTATLIQRQFGLTADHIQAIYTVSALSGKSFKDTFDTINAISKVEGGRNRIMMTERQTMGQISKLSSLVLMNFKGNIPALTEAVVRAKKLGVELNDIQGTTGQFLDFESSISKEFEAQMFTGEDLNLQQLRRLALAHDTKGMMEEIGRRIPTLDKWNNMNTLAQEAYAEALGMSSEKIAEIIQKQQIANRLGVDASLNASEMYRKLFDQYKNHEKVVEVMKAAGAQQYLNASMSEKIDTFMQNIKNTLGQMLEGELGQTITKFVNLLNNAEKIKEIVGQIQGFVRGIVRFFGDLPKTIQKVITAASIFLGLVGAAEMALGFAMLPVNPIGGAAMILGGGKMLALAGGAGYAASQLGDLITVSDNAARNQVYSSPIIPTQQSAAKVNQPINVNVNNNMTLEGDKLYLHTLKNIQSTPPMDNNQGQYFTPNSISFSGQPAS